MYSRSFELVKETFVNVVRFEWTTSLNVTSCELLLPDPVKCHVFPWLFLGGPPSPPPPSELFSSFTVATVLEEL